MAIVLKSPYLIGIALFVIMISTANTILYFEQLRLVKDMFDDPEQRTQMFARIDFIVQTLTVISQVLITGRLAQKLGVTALLVILPLMIMGGFLILASMGTFLVLATVMILRRWGEYAFIRPGREMLWSRLDTETQVQGEEFHRRDRLPLLRCRGRPGTGCAQGRRHESRAGRLVRCRRVRRCGPSTAGGWAAASTRKKSRSRSPSVGGNRTRCGPFC